jgi:nicotinamide-nucleotide amidase
MQNKKLKILHDRLICSGISVSVAESCTGGLLSGLLTSLPGSSGYFRLGVVTYSDSAKTRLLKIPEKMIKQEGAVSAYTAQKMSSSARALASSGISAAITGIAGPSGARPGKPVGTVFIAVSTAQRTICRRFLFRGTRSYIRKQSAEKAIEMLIASLHSAKCARS